MAFIGNSVTTQGFTPAIDYFSGNGSTVTFTLSRPVASVAQMIVAVANVIQNPSLAYTVSGNSITFSSAPPSGTNNIWVEYTSLITTYNAISQSPSVIGDITASGGFFAKGNFNNTYDDGTVVDYVTGNGRITVGSADGFTIYTGGTTGRVALAKWDVTTNSVGIGYQALNSNTANNNTAVGYQAGYSNTTGIQNTYVGQGAGYSNSTAAYNAFFGQNAGYNATGASNTLLGVSAGYYITSGAKNTVIGQYNGNQGGLDIRTASNYIVLSDGDGNPCQIITNNGVKLFYQQNISTIAYGEGIAGSWANVSSTSFDINTVFPGMNLPSTSCIGVILQIASSSGGAGNGMSSLINLNRSGGTWYISSINQVGGQTVSVSASGTTITLNFSIGAQYGYAHARVIQHG